MRRRPAPGLPRPLPGPAGRSPSRGVRRHAGGGACRPSHPAHGMHARARIRGWRGVPPPFRAYQARPRTPWRLAEPDAMRQVRAWGGRLHRPPFAMRPQETSPQCSRPSLRASFQPTCSCRRGARRSCPDAEPGMQQAILAGWTRRRAPRSGPRGRRQLAVRGAAHTRAEQPAARNVVHARPAPLSEVVAIIRLRPRHRGGPPRATGCAP